MSLYNMLFGVNSAAPVLLATLGLTANDVPRFRDCYLDGEQIVIHTRTGGGNRAYYDSEESCRANYPEYFDGKEDPTGPWNSTLTANDCYLYDEDDDFDCTYANFHFKFPEEYADDLKALAAKSETHTPSEKWQALFKAMESHTAEAAQAQVQDAKDADTTDQTAIVDSAGNIKYVHVEIFNAMKARAEEAEAMFFKATQDAKDAEVYAEIDRTTAKFPTWPTDPLHAVSVLGEEYGELVKATLQHTYEPHKSDLSDVREEAIQTAAMALRFARSIDRYEFVRCKQHSQDAEMAKESGR